MLLNLFGLYNWFPISLVLRAFMNTLDTLERPGVTAMTDAEEFKVWKIEVMLLKLNLRVPAIIAAWLFPRIS